MAVNWSSQVYLPNFNFYARVVIITPLVSQPGAPPYPARGIYDTEPIDVLAEEGSVFSDQRVVLDILEVEFPVRPVQGDELNIPAADGLPALGDFKIIETKTNGGGETSLSLQEIVTAEPQ